MQVSGPAALKDIGTLPGDWGDAMARPRLARSSSRSTRRSVGPGPSGGLPAAAYVFAAFRLTPFARVRAVILGQDPYHRPGQAQGLAFSVPDGCSNSHPPCGTSAPKLLSDLGLAAPASGSLASWADHGVLLLNTALTVREGSPGSHGRAFWDPFIAGTIAAIAEKKEPVAFLLWGRHAQDWARLIDGEQHPLVLSAHPSPLSARRGFLGSRPFSRANAALAERGATPVDWSLA